jgi:hypothetical protein
MRVTKRRLERRDNRRARILEERAALARELAASPTVTVGLRIPVRLNEWLDGYVHGAWPERVRKQELVVEALRLLVARRGGPGEVSISTDLLDVKAVS